MLQTVLSAHSLHHVHARCQMLQLHRLIGLSIKPLAPIYAILQRVDYLHSCTVEVGEGNLFQTVGLHAFREVDCKGGGLRAERQTHLAFMTLAADVGDDGRHVEVEESRHSQKIVSAIAVGASQLSL